MSQNHREGMEKRLNELVYDLLSIAEFECGWQQMLNFDAAKNDHLINLYNLRKMWVPVYFKTNSVPSFILLQEVRAQILISWIMSYQTFP
jgi:hypothetical protein